MNLQIEKDFWDDKKKSVNDSEFYKRSTDEVIV